MANNGDLLKVEASNPTEGAWTFAVKAGSEHSVNNPTGVKNVSTSEDISSTGELNKKLNVVATEIDFVCLTDTTKGDHDFANVLAASTVPTTFTFTYLNGSQASLVGSLFDEIKVNFATGEMPMKIHGSYSKL